MDSATYRAQLRNVLDASTGHLIRRMREFIGAPQPSASYVDFESIADPHGNDFPILVGLFDGDGATGTAKERTFFHVVPFRLPPNLNPSAMDWGTLDASDEYDDVFFSWFRECWVSAGGLNYNIPAFIGERDGFDWLNLSSGEWINRMK